jgi:cytochrome c oxidase assembly protein Cox11
MCFASLQLKPTDFRQVPVIYLVEPTAQNLQAVTSDLSRGLYSQSAGMRKLHFV